MAERGSACRALHAARLFFAVPAIDARSGGALVTFVYIRSGRQDRAALVCCDIGMRFQLSITRRHMPPAGWEAPGRWRAVPAASPQPQRPRVWAC
ncbi:hypothetical protein WS68_20770 [Burkholderia sp. TSV86]|nr:hypothetical protein WS68_20770 [Burkholderia sp. TSV86]